MPRPAALALVLLAPVSCLAATIHVPADQPTIKDGMLAAASGDTVLVACGTYSEYAIGLVGGVTLLSATGDASCVTIDAGGHATILQGSSLTGTVTIEGFTLRGAVTSNGGGINVQTSDQVVVRDCRFADNVAFLNGGGIWASGAPLMVEGSEFESNDVRNAGGGIYSRESTLQVSDCSFELNSVTEIGYGFIGRGGGVGIENGTGQSSVSTSSFIDNYGRAGGSFAWVFDSTVDFIDCFVASHQSTSLWVDGGAEVNVSESVFTENRRGIRCQSSNLGLDRCSLYGHIVGAAVILNGSVAVVDRTIVHFGERQGFGCSSSMLTITCSDLFGTASPYGACAPDTMGVIVDDPRFCDPTGGDFTLDATSPCRHTVSPCSETIGPFGVGCVSTGVEAFLEPRSWGAIRGLYR